MELVSGAVLRATATDSDGRFEFQHLGAARYSLTASKTGYVTLRYGQRRPFQDGRFLELANGQVLDKVDMRLPPAGVIAGRVVDDLGEPVPRVMVTALRQGFRAGQPSLAAVASSLGTDDLGQFRVSGLPPGTYYVGSVASGGLAAGGAVSGAGALPVPTFHPSAIAQHEATPVTVKLGQEVRGVDISLVQSRAASISGAAIDSSGRPVQDFTVSIRGANGNLLSMLSQVVAVRAQDGKFALRNMAPADYLLRISGTNQGTGEKESSELTVTVGEAGVEGLTVVLSPPARIRGRVVWDGEEQPPCAPTTLWVGASSIPSIASGKVTANWTFEVKDVVAALTRLDVSPLPAGWSLSRVLYEDRELDDRSLNALSGATLDVTLVLTNQPTSVSGSVTDADDAPVADYTVLLFSDDGGRPRPAGARAVRSDQRGAYRTVDLPPGKYWAIALEYLDDGEEQNPEFLSWARERAVRVEVPRDQPVTLNLKLVKYEGGL